MTFSLILSHEAQLVGQTGGGAMGVFGVFRMAEQWRAKRASKRTDHA